MIVIYMMQIIYIISDLYNVSNLYNISNCSTINIQAFQNNNNAQIAHTYNTYKFRIKQYLLYNICNPIQNVPNNSFNMPPSPLQKFRQKIKQSFNMPQAKFKLPLSHKLNQSHQQESTKSDTQRQFQIEKKDFQSKYTLAEQIGQGAHGVVRICLKNQKQEKFAVKIMHLDQEMTFLHRKNFLTMKCLHHDNIVKYKSLYLDQTKRACYLIMQHIDYPSLKGYIVKDQAQLRQIASQILSSLSYMHLKQICHRDLKPQNILYNPLNQQLKLIDFGVCKKMTIRHQKTQMYTPTGTLIYKAPEMFYGEGYDEGVDMWALGVVMYQLVTGKKLFQQQYVVDTIKSITNQQNQITFQAPAWKEYSSFCQDLIYHLLKRNPKERLNVDEAINHLFFQKTSDGLDMTSSNYSYRNFRNKTEKKIAEGYIHSIMYLKPNPQGDQPEVQKKMQLSKSIKLLQFQLVQSEDDQGIVQI